MAEGASTEAAGSRWLRPFARVTSGGRFLPEIDGLRAVAIGLVLLFHLAADLQAKAIGWDIPVSGLLATPARFGFRGVELFFVISGFILGLPFAAHHLSGRPAIPLRSYFMRRVTRLEPPYIITMVGAFVAHILLRGRSAAVLWPHLAAGLVYQNSLIFGSENPVDGVAWSLEVEIQFYILVPLLSQVFRIRSDALRRGILVGAMLLSATLASLFITPEMRAWLSILRFLQFFLGGFLVADLFLLDWSKAPHHSARWDLFALVATPLLFVLFARSGPPGPRGEPLLPFLALTLFAPLFCAATFRGRWLNRLLANPWVTTFGGMCYSIYLLHNLLLGGILRLTDGWHPTGRWPADLLLQGAVALPLMMVPIALFFLAVEKPCMQRDWPQRLRAALAGSRT